ncbi:DUF2537 domain-containing protein [Nocardia sp. NPDC052566]|uniref:DUF2537 domain-containing protein n=1 Tax=Nocardia sp. NPDC052566 TaxID=3364330 RepID=UPI0037C6BB0F
MTGGYLPDGSYPRSQPDRDPTPWGGGLLVAIMVALLAALAVYGFGSALAQVERFGTLLSIVVNLVAAGGAAPTLWRWRTTPVTRWVAAGIAVGVLLGWLVLLLGVLF